MKLLFKHNIHIICCGDPAQLPPINKEKDNHLLDNPHVFLDEVLRQAQESEIIRVSMDIRAGRPLKPMSGKEVIIARKEDLNTGMLNWADQILCATNKTRHELNAMIRKMKGIESICPVDGDKMICLRNYWEDDFKCEEPLINGTIGYLKNSFESFNKIPFYLGGGEIPLVCGEIESDGITFKELSMDKNMIIQEKKTLSSKIEYRLGKDKKYKHLIPLEFTYGYAITAHKAQGSQWGKVLAIEENFPFEKEEHQRWLYTCCTRPVDKLVLIQKG
ncbi:MAG: aTP-dependent exoDNAse, alpha [Caudoviricetes sp.]|nr:MAG: aTP-dependent exoDNAse, alpha [Caudoviricetes sp.]